MVKQLSNQSKWKPWKGVALFIITMLWIVLGTILQKFIGIPGLLVTQLGFLAIGVIFCLTHKTSPKEVFPIKKVTFRDVAGAILMLIGSFPIGIMTTFLMGIIMPDTYNNVVNGLTTESVSTSIILLTFIGMVILPPICEEALCRGAFLSNFRGLKKEWAIMIIVGVMFGIMHGDPIRFFNTAIFGVITSYIILKRENIFLTVLIHFINNFFTVGISLLLSLATAGATEGMEIAEESMDVASSLSAALPVTMILFFLSPVVIALGAHLISRQREISTGEASKGLKFGHKMIISSIASVALLAGGIAMLVI